MVPCFHSASCLVSNLINTFPKLGRHRCRSMLGHHDDTSSASLPAIVCCLDSVTVAFYYTRYTSHHNRFEQTCEYRTHSQQPAKHQTTSSQLN
ncbi:hypothetical protein GE21DRAFT_1044399 [Neurospora crassa]|nr:hypothetical protein GE21DRAFT_1044399 [Neurospora crassa]